MTTCYRLLVEDEQREALRAAQERVVLAERELDEAMTERNALFRKLHFKGIGASAIAAVLEMHRTTVQRIITPSPRYRATGERKS